MGRSWVGCEVAPETILSYMTSSDPQNSRDRVREFGRDGISGLVSADRALRAREVSRPSSEEYAEAERTADGLLARLEGRRRGR